MKRRNRAGAPAIEIVDTRMNPNDDPRELALARDGVRLARAQGYFLHGGYDGPVIVVTTGDRVIASAPIYSDWDQGFARFALAAVPGREDALPGLISELRAWARHELKSGELIAESPVLSVVPALRAAGYVQRGADWHRPIAANVNAAGGKRRNRAGKVRPKSEDDARKIARDALQKAEKAIRSLRFDPESGLIAQEDRAVAAFNRLRDRATDAAPYLPREENDAITDALRNLRAMLDESIANASTVAKQARSKIYAAADREASIERLARAFQREGHSLADARKIARFRHENHAGGKRRGARR